MMSVPRCSHLAPAKRSSRTSRSPHRPRLHALARQDGDRGKRRRPRAIIIREVPYGVNRATLQERIAELVNEKILTGISGMRDLSDEDTRIEIELKRDARPQVVVNQLFKLTSMETSFSVNMLAIHKNRPKQLSLKEAIDAYIEHRREVVIRRTRYLLGKAEERAELLEAFLLALGHLDDFIEIIRDSNNRDEARERLAAYDFPGATAEASRHPDPLAGRRPGRALRLHRAPGQRHPRSAALSAHRHGARQGQGRIRRRARRDQGSAGHPGARGTGAAHHQGRAAGHQGQVRHAPQVPRSSPKSAKIAMEDLIANDAMIVTLSHRGYIKRTPASEYRVQGRGGKGLKGMETRAAGKDEPDDFVEHLFSAQAHDYLMFFTNTGRVYVERVYELPEGSRTAMGRSIRNVLNLKPEEKIAALLRLERTRRRQRQ